MTIGRSRLDLAAVGGPACLAGALAFYEIGRRSLWLDEAASVTIARQHGAALGAAMAHDGGNMLAYYALLHLVIGLFGSSELVIRLPSALADVATVALVGALARRLFDPRVAFFAGVLTAVSLPLVFWGQDARGYALMVTFVSASFFSFVCLVERRGAKRSTFWAWSGYVGATTIATYLGFVAALIVPAQLLVLAACYRRRLPWALSAMLASGLCCVPLGVLAIRRGTGQLFWVPKPSSRGLVLVLESLTSAGFEPNFPPTPTSGALLALTLALLAVAGALILGSAPRLLAGGEERMVFARLLLLSWLVVPVALAAAESWAGQSIFLARNLLISLPPVGLLLAWLLAGGQLSRRLWPSGASWGSFAVLLVLRGLQVAPSYGVSPENWQAAVAYVLARSEPGDCVAFYPSDGRSVFQYYLGQHTPRSARAPRSVLPAVGWSEIRPYVEDYATFSRAQLSQLPGECPRLWLVASHQGQQDGPSVSRLNYARFIALRQGLAAEFRDHREVSFGYAAPVDVELFS